jgi:hypothetical protein
MEVCVEPEVEMVPIGVEEMDVVEAVFETPHTQSMFIEEKWKGKEKELPPIPVLSRGTTSAS